MNMTENMASTRKANLLLAISISQTPELSAEVIGCSINYPDIGKPSGDNSGASEDKDVTFEQALSRMKIWFQNNW